MKRIKAITALLVLVTGMTNVAFAQNDAHTVTVEVQAINEIAIAGDVSLTISTATAGQAPDDATGSTTYAVTTNDAGGAMKITASTSVDPSTLGTGSGGVVLAVVADAPAGGDSAGSVSLNTTAANLVTGIDAVSQSGLTLGYTLSATAATGQLTSTAITVTYTITN